MYFEPAYNRLPLAPIGKRIGSFALDFFGCAFIGKLGESLLGINEQSGWGLVVFALVWGGDRVLFAGNNQGQSLGRWLLSLKTVDMQYGKSSGIAELFKRELVVYPFLAFVLAASKSPTSLALFAVLPLVIDAAFAIADSRKMQTLHDKLGKTIVIETRRGFQVDQKLSKLFRQLSKMPRPSFPKRNVSEGNFDDYFNPRPPKSFKRRPRRRE
ncbi:hypothetical protein Syn7502_01215 [Synechococcus sp. PCC 7502]|uniref:RDD family protein n=1 Tax=Synechococcus sp. PCC 7502 TaxID=1173263 RepID=UPI00029FDE30|nr:RDD family protein [Synechococcus sp. PCC 7502]AFY73318.1 hypothetical protein Syn7502_01215 [Synechococcus sp. PCC 7502]